MNFDFNYKGPGRSFRWRYSGPPWVFLVGVILAALGIVGMIVVKTFMVF